MFTNKKKIYLFFKKFNGCFLQLICNKCQYVGFFPFSNKIDRRIIWQKMIRFQNFVSTLSEETVLHLNSLFMEGNNSWWQWQMVLTATTPCAVCSQISSLCNTIPHKNLWGFYFWKIKVSSPSLWQHPWILRNCLYFFMLGLPAPFPDTPWF